MSIKYVKGDFTYPVGDGSKILAHICNSHGGWGAGAVLSISARWPEPEQQYREWYRSIQTGEIPANTFSLGNTQFVKVEPDIAVANMIAQILGYGQNGEPPIRYYALEQCLSGVAHRASLINASVHMPRIGTGLAGGTWEEIEPIIQRTLISKDIPVTVYDLP